MKKPVGILVCENLLKEVLKVLSEEKEEISDKISVISYPCHCVSSKDWQSGFNKVIGKISDECSRFCIVNCACSYRVKVPKEYSKRIFPIKEGAELFISEDLFSRKVSEGYYFMNPSMAKHLVSSDFILPSLPKSFSDSEESSGGLIKKIFIYDTGTDDKSDEYGKKITEITGIPVQREYIGVDYFRLSLMLSIKSEICSYEKKILLSQDDERKKQLADSLMAMDLINSVARLDNEKEVISSILDLFTTLFSPECTAYSPVVNKKAGEIIQRPKNAKFPEFESTIKSESGLKSETVLNGGFIFPVRHMDETVGVIGVNRVEFPRYLERYRNSALFMLGVCGLSIANARTYNQLNSALLMREEEIELRKKAELSLSVAIKKLSLLSGITRHDILNQIMVADAYLDMVVEDSPEEFRGRLNLVKKAVSEIQKQIEFTRDYQDMGVSPPGWYDIEPLVKSCLKNISEDRGIEVSVRLPKIEVYADPMLGKVFCNIISNAFNHAEGMTELSVSAKESDEGLLIFFKDNGEGVSDDKKEIIFKAGVGKNHGYGLFLVREVLEITGISIKETGTFKKGACFEIKVPPDCYRLY